MICPSRVPGVMCNSTRILSYILGVTTLSFSILPRCQSSWLPFSSSLWCVCTIYLYVFTKSWNSSDFQTFRLCVTWACFHFFFQNWGRISPWAVRVTVLKNAVLLLQRLSPYLHLSSPPLQRREGRYSWLRFVCLSLSPYGQVESVC